MIHHALVKLFSEPLLLDGNYLTGLLATISAITQGDIHVAEAQFFKDARARFAPKHTVTKGVAVVPITGALMRRPDVLDMAFGDWEDTDAAANAVSQAAADPEAGSMVISIDSPGGVLTGGPELAQAIAAADKIKPTISHTSGTMASLAFWAGSQAREVIATPSARVGSIGAFTMLVDQTALMARIGIGIDVVRNKEGTFKAIGVGGTSVTEEQRAHVQAEVQAAFNDFKKAVKTKRPDLNEDHMKGQVFQGVEARRLGLVDRVGSLSFAMGVARRMAG